MQPATSRCGGRRNGGRRLGGSGARGPRRSGGRPAGGRRGSPRGAACSPGREPSHPRRSRGACRGRGRSGLPLSLAATVAGARSAAPRAPGRCPPVHRRPVHGGDEPDADDDARSAGRALTANTCSCMIRTRVRTDHPHRSGRAGALGAVRPGDGRDGPEQYYRVEAGDTLWSIAVSHYAGDPREGVWELRQRNHLTGTTIQPGNGSCSRRRRRFDRPDGARRAYDRLPARKETELASERILELLRRPVDGDEYHEIRELWKPALDRRGQPRPAGAHLDAHRGLRLQGRRHRGALREGPDGAARFYTELLTTFPDIHFDLEYIVIGPQGVCEEARVTATHSGGGSRTSRRASGSSGATRSSSRGTRRRGSSAGRWSTPISR